MRFSTLAAVLAVGLVGCVNDAPSQSTLPQPIVVAGPPGGGMDPSVNDEQYAGDPAYENQAPAETAQPSDEVAEAPAAGPAEAAPMPYGAAPPEADPEAPAAAPGNPMGDVTDGEIDATLDAYGQWIDTDDYGAVWRPDATVVGADFTPYETGGAWEYSDYGWAFAADWDWAWLPFHYGRWAWFEDYWGWVPDYSWGPSWCEWRNGNGVIGWRPMGPRIRDHRDPHRPHRPVVNPNVRDHRHPQQHEMHWRFAAEKNFSKGRIHAHVMNNLGEGLRLTSVVAKPPGRASSVAAADLMKQRYARATYTGSGNRQPTRQMTYQPPRPYDPPSRQGPAYTYRPPSRTYQPTHTYNPQTQSYQPTRNYNPPATYNGGNRSYNPPGNTRSYNPPATYNGANRSYNPPATYNGGNRSYNPRATYNGGSRSYNPPATSSGGNRSYHPPSSGGGNRSFSPSGGGSSHYSPPSHSSGGGSHSSGGSSHSSSSGGSHSSSSGSSHSSGGSSHSSSGGGGHHR